ncbi:MAG: molybdate ABC transporter permease subunit [Acidimicrobiia bacterium]|nr:molybdate ABC transporter permease subunit [Acidimicrobiia bacterium]
MKVPTRRVTQSAPPALVALAVIGAVFFLVPVVGIVAQVPWRSLPEIFRSDIVANAVRLSLIASVGAVTAATVIGLPLAWVLARVDFAFKPLVRGLVLLPMVLPPVVGGAALLFGFGRRGIVGGPLYDATGFVLPFSVWGVIVASTFVAMPFLVITVEAALRTVDRRYEGAASTLGASPWTVLRRVTIPLVSPAVVSGLLLTWARALGEFGATITFAGNLQGRTQTLPLAVFVALETDRDAAVAISVLMMVISLGVLVSLRDRWWGAHS